MMCQENTSKAHTSETSWAALKPDLLYIIFRKLCDITDLIVFCAVCKAWRNSTNLSEPPPQFPCLIEWPFVEGDSLRMYSPASKRYHISRVPNTHFYGPVGPVFQDMLIKSHSGYYFSYLNPLTRVKNYCSSADPSSVYIPYPSPSYVPHKFVFNLSTDKFIIQHLGGSRHVLYYKGSEQDWNQIFKFDDLRSAAFYKNQYFLLESKNDDYQMMIMDENDRPNLLSVPFQNKGFDLTYLIATTDHLLVVRASIPPYMKEINECQFEVHRLDNYPQNPGLTKLSGIGDVMLFLDHRNCLSLTAGDYRGVKGNCIYFIALKKSQLGTKHVIGRYDIGLNKVEELPGPDWFDIGHNPLPVKAAWFVPSL